MLHQDGYYGKVGQDGYYMVSVHDGSKLEICKRVKMYGETYDGGVIVL